MLELDFIHEVVRVCALRLQRDTTMFLTSKINGSSTDLKIALLVTGIISGIDVYVKYLRLRATVSRNNISTTICVVSLSQVFALSRQGKISCLYLQLNWIILSIKNL